MYKRTQGGAILKTEFKENKKVKERERENKGEREKKRGRRKKTEEKGEVEVRAVGRQMLEKGMEVRTRQGHNNSA